MAAEIEIKTPLQIERTSDVLKKMVVDSKDTTISIDEIFSNLGERSFGILMLMFAIPGAIPSLPLTSILSIPLLVFAVQLTLGYKKPYLPKYFLEMTFERTTFNNIVTKSSKYLIIFEKLCKPRYLWLTDKKYEKLHGILILVLALIFLLPLPFVNWLPSFAICLIAMAIIERDGVVMLGGIVTSIVTVILALGMIGAIIALIGKFFSFVTS